MAACAIIDPSQEAKVVASTAGFEPFLIDAGRFDLAAQVRPAEPGKPLTIYIEGDGRAWLDRFRPSPDPTPTNPLALRLAASDPGQQVAYLARPCQYGGAGPGRNCSVDDWTGGRFSPAVVDAMDAAVERLKTRAGARELILIGYSGGGAIAALLAARRADVARLVTVAAPLDLAAWTALHRLTPLKNSLDPASFASALQAVRQVHLVGEEDEVVPPAVARAFVDALGPTANAEIVVVPDQGHACCWEELWPRLVADATAGP